MQYWQAGSFRAFGAFHGSVLGLIQSTLGHSKATPGRSAYLQTRCRAERGPRRFRNLSGMLQEHFNKLRRPISLSASSMRLKDSQRLLHGSKSRLHLKFEFTYLQLKMRAYLYKVADTAYLIRIKCPNMRMLCVPRGIALARLMMRL